MSTPCWGVSTAPAQSNTTSIHSPATAATGSASEALTALSAPTASAIVRRASTRSVASTTVAPAAWHATDTIRPIGPEPRMATRSPRVTPARSTAWTPQANGSTNAPSSVVSPSGNG